MPLISWSNEYSVGVKSLDSQHINLFNILNELHESMKNGQDQVSFRPLLQRLLQFSQEHFAEEEKFLERMRYPGLARQRAQHNAMTVRVAEFLTRYVQGEKSLTGELLFFLSDWLRKHILCEDKEYTAWAARRGAA
jgi:hemerythrin